MVSTLRKKTATTQNSLPANYPAWVKILSFIAFSYAIVAFLNEALFHWQQGKDGSFPFWLSHWTEYVIIVVFGVWRTIAEKNTYTRKRLAVLTVSVGILWWLVPAYLKIPEPYVGSLPKQAWLPSLHTPGTLTFFLVLVLVFLFGRRIICGWCCPCVGIRETVGFPFRINTLRTLASRKYLRHGKWFFFALYVISFFLIFFHSDSVSLVYKAFLALITLPYFLSMLLSPFLGNRSYCRFVCPYGATFGLLNRIGFFRLTLDRKQCTGCGICEQVCDMGIPVSTLGRESGEIKVVEECMGCARCVVSCPKNALEIRDIANVFHPKLRRDAKHLLRRQKRERTSDGK
jgi:glutamate synthase (NADPH) small chain